MFHKLNVSKLAVPFLAILLLIPAKESFAWGDRDRDHHHHEYPHFGLRVSILPASFFTVAVGGSRYYYCDGVYYSRAGAEYVVMAPPIGAVVSTVTPDYTPVIVNGITYYTSNGIYYVYTPQGYQVVPQPVTVVTTVPTVVQAQTPQPVVVNQTTAPAPAPVTVTAASSPNAEDVFTVNIPNNKGDGYVPVTLKRSGEGFVGPQGEFYPQFPRVAQLRVMYVK